MTGPVAAVACGTNSTRLLVAGGDGRVLERQLRVTRLGEGVDATRRLTPGAVGRTVAVLAEYRARMAAAGVERVRVAATSAVRDAADRDGFLAAAEAAVGVRPELLDGEAEARLCFRAATARLGPAAGRVLVVDIGGGSTELAVGPAAGRVAAGGQAAAGEPEAVWSLDVGGVRLAERVLGGDRPGPAALAAAQALVRDHLDAAARAVPALAGAERLVLLAGPVTGLAAVRERLTAVDGTGQLALARAAVEDLVATLATAPEGDRPPASGLDAALADILLAGASILVTIMRRFGFDPCLVTDADLLDGLVLSLLEPVHPARSGARIAPETARFAHQFATGGRPEPRSG